MYTDMWTVNIPRWGSWGGGCMYGKCFYVLSIFDTEHELIMLPSQKGIYFCWTLTQKFFLKEAQGPGALKWKNKQWTT